MRVAAQGCDAGASKSDVSDFDHFKTIGAVSRAIFAWNPAFEI
jgi:hypothetical protein